jgi:hypothetical protein
MRRSAGMHSRHGQIQTPGATAAMTHAVWN